MMRLHPHPVLPSQSTEAVKQSLDYWQRSVQMMCTDDNMIKQPQTSVSPATQTHLEIDANKDTSLSSAPQQLSPNPILTWDLARELRKALIQQADVWQSLLLYRQSLKTYTRENVTRKIYNNFIQQFEQTSDSNLNSINDAHKKILSRDRMIAIFSALLVLLVIILLIPWPGLQNKNLFNIIIAAATVITATVITGFVATATVVTTFVGTLADTSAKVRAAIFNEDSSSPKQSTDDSGGKVDLDPTQLASGLKNLEIIATLEGGYQQFLIEFNDLNQDVSVTYPHIEFLTNSTKLSKDPIQDSYDFLTKIIWTDKGRKEEIEQRARAAFGLVGTYVATKLEKASTAEPSDQSTDNSRSNAKGK